MANLESSYLADKVLADLTTHQMAIIDSYCESSYLEDQVLADLSPKMAILEIPTLRGHVRQTRCWQIYPPHQTVITDS